MFHAMMCIADSFKEGKGLAMLRQDFTEDIEGMEKAFIAFPLQTAKLLITAQALASIIRRGVFKCVFNYNVKLRQMMEARLLGSNRG